MAETVEEATLGALNTRLATLTFSPVIPVAWQNIKYTPTVGTPYLRPTLRRADPAQVTLGPAGYNRHQGFYQVDLFDKIEIGEAALLKKASAIVAHFKRGTVLIREGFTVRIMRPPAVLPITYENGWSMTPVRVFWTCDAGNPA
jgi:hypothetical protein